MHSLGGSLSQLRKSAEVGRYFTNINTKFDGLRAILWRFTYLLIFMRSYKGQIIAMNSEIRNVVVLGSGGRMGSLVGGLCAQAGLEVAFASRTKENAQAGVERAVRDARSYAIAKKATSVDLDDAFSSYVPKADWIIDCVSENVSIKHNILDRIEHKINRKAIITTTTSSIPLSTLIEGRGEDFRRRFMATHFYNPPSKMLACEISSCGYTDALIYDYMTKFLIEKLRRIVIPVKNEAAFAGNRIAFLLFCQICSLADEYGIQLMDYLIGPYTGRIMTPCATLDLIGLDVYKAIVQSISENTKDEMNELFCLPQYVTEIIHDGALGSKTPERGGLRKLGKDGNMLFCNPSTLDYIPAKLIAVDFVEHAKREIAIGKYLRAYEIIASAKSKEAEIVKDILYTYISYAYSLVGIVCDHKYGIGGIDNVMRYGFNWAPPSILLSLLGGAKSLSNWIDRNARGYIVDIPSNVEEFQIHEFSIGRYFFV